MKKILAALVLLSGLTGCGGNKHDPKLYCSEKGGKTAFSELQSYMRKQNNFYKASVHKPIIQYMGGCKHGVAAVAERRASFPGILKMYSAEVIYDQDSKIWMINNLTYD